MYLLSSLLCFYNTPLSLTLIVHTILVCLVTGFLSGLSGFSYILFLIFLGATLVLFIHITSLASKEIFKMIPIMTVVILVRFVASPFMFFMETKMLPNKEALESSFLMYPQKLVGTQIKLDNMYNPVSANLTALIVLYLSLTLIIVAKLSSSFFGPLRLSSW